MHVAIYLPTSFYAAVASTTVEILQAINDVRQEEALTFEFISVRRAATSKSGISFRTRARPERHVDLLIVLAGKESEQAQTLMLLEHEAADLQPIVAQAQRDGAVIAGSCAAAYLLAAVGLLDGKRATISWWLKAAARQRYPKVLWDIDQLIIEDHGIYTSGAAFSGIDLIMRLMGDLGFVEDLQYVRRLLVLPPIRDLQSPYESPLRNLQTSAFNGKMMTIVEKHLEDCTPNFLAAKLHMSSRTLTRRCLDEYGVSTGKWLQKQRLEKAKDILEKTELSLARVCEAIGYEDTASFSRLFKHTVGITPAEYRKRFTMHGQFGANMTKS